MKFSPTLQSIGALQLLLAAVLLVPLLISLLYGENDTPAILAAIGIAILIGGPLFSTRLSSWSVLVFFLCQDGRGFL